MNYIDKLQKNLNAINVRKLSPNANFSGLNKSNLSFSPVNTKKNYNDVFITFKIDNTRKINKLIENNLCTFSSNMNNNYTKNNNNFSNSKSKIFFNLNNENEHDTENMSNKQIIKNKTAIFNAKTSSKKFDYIHYSDIVAKKHEYRSHNINFSKTNQKLNINNKFPENISSSKFLRQNFLEKRHQIIKERISRSLSNSKRDKDSKNNLYSRDFLFVKNDSEINQKNFYYESDKESSNLKNSLGEFNKERNNNLICNLRNKMHNHNQTSSRFEARKAAYEKSTKNISFLAFKNNQEKANEMNIVNFMNSQNRIRNQNSCFQSHDTSFKPNINVNKNDYEEGDIYNEGVINDEDNHGLSRKSRITCKMINDAEVINKWFTSLKIKDLESFRFFDDSYRDNTKYIKNTEKGSIMSEIKKG